MAIIKAIRERRSIRRFRKEPVPDEVLLDILDAARYSPSWANTQVWEFIIIKDDATKELLSGTLSPANPSINAVKEAPVVLVACGKKGISGFYKGTPSTVLGDWLMFDVALIIGTLNLAAHARGLGMVHVGAFNIPRVAEILGVNDSSQVVEILPLGYPDHSPGATKRKEVSEFIYHEKYGNKENKSH